MLCVFSYPPSFLYFINLVKGLFFLSWYGIMMLSKYYFIMR